MWELAHSLHTFHPEEDVEFYGTTLPRCIETRGEDCPLSRPEGIASIEVCHHSTLSRISRPLGVTVRFTNKCTHPCMPSGVRIDRHVVRNAGSRDRRLSVGSRDGG